MITDTCAPYRKLFEPKPGEQRDWLEVPGMPRRFQQLSLREMVRQLHPGERAKVVHQYGKLIQSSAQLPQVAPLLLGRASVGKSYAAAVLARAADETLRRRQASQATAWLNCATDLQYVDGFADKWLPILCNEIRFLVVDDFGLVQPGSFEAKQLVAIASARYDAGLPTLWTGNFDATSAEDLWQQVGHRFGTAGPNMIHRLREGSEGFRGLFE